MNRTLPASLSRRAAGFTLIEIILVVIITLILGGITLPHFARTFRGTQLRIAARTLTRMGRYARETAVMRGTTTVVAVDPERMVVLFGTEQEPPPTTNAADGRLDQEVLRRLHYVDDTGDDGRPPFSVEIRRRLPEGLQVADFEKEESGDALPDSRYHIVRFYPDGQCDDFRLILEDRRGNRVLLESDPVAGKILSRFVR